MTGPAVANGDQEAKVPNGGLAEGDSTGGVACKPGRLVGAYDVGKAVGKGGYAIVYKGIRHEDGRIIAVKKVEIFEMTQKKRERCLTEVTLLHQLSHPFVIQMLDAFIDENMLIIIFEWAPAGDLKRLIKKTAEAGRTLDEASIWSFFAQITDALRYMHQHRIMHRDIKPANVLVGANGALKLADLGLGRQLSEQTMEAFSKVGTPYYVSPEVVRGAGYDWKSDVWSMGCLLYELACLRSPFEMEGANLYDVFQKISKGEYNPLPADQFSSSLRSLVVRMLSVEPSQRPDLEEVWAITQKITQSQTKSRQDVHSVSEALYQQLTLLEAHVGEQNRVKGGACGSSSRAGSSTANGKHNASAALGGKLEPAPAEALRAMHPLFLAERFGHLASHDADDNQKRQLGVFMQIFSWLVKLNGKPEFSMPIDEQLEMQPIHGKGRVGGVRPPAQPPPPAAVGSKPSGRSSSRKVSASAASASAPEPDQPLAPPVCTPICINLLKGADAVKRAAQGLGLSTEFAPVNALATGYGRAVCSILQEVLEMTASRLQPTALKPCYINDDASTVDEEGDGGDASFGDGDEANVLSAATPLRYPDDDDDEAEAVYYMTGHDALHQRALSSTTGSASSSGRGRAGSQRDDRHLSHLRPHSAELLAGGSSSAPGSRTQTPTKRTKTPTQRSRTPNDIGLRGAQQRSEAPVLFANQVDPVAWKLELERLAPQLGHIQISADSAAAGDWNQRWQQLKKGALEVAAGGKACKAPMQGLSDAVAKDIDRISTSERHINNNAEGLLQQYRAARQRLSELQLDVGQQEELSQIGHNAIAQINRQLEEMQQMMQEQASSISSSTHVKNIQEAIQRLIREMKGMDLRIGVIQQALTSRHRKQIAGNFTWDKDEAYED